VLELDVQAQLRQVEKIFQRHRRDAKAPLALGHNQRVADEPRDRLAQGAGADLVMRLQVFNPHFSPGARRPSMMSSRSCA